MDAVNRWSKAPAGAFVLAFAFLVMVWAPTTAGDGEDSTSALYVGGNTSESGSSVGWVCVGDDEPAVVAVMGCDLRCPGLECSVTVDDVGPRTPGFWSECAYNGSQGEWTDGHTRWMPRCVGGEILVLPGIGATVGEIRLTVT